MKGGISIAEVDFAAFEIGVFPINSEWPASATVSERQFANTNSRVVHHHRRFVLRIAFGH